MLQWRTGATAPFRSSESGGGLLPDVAKLMGASVEFNRDSEIFEQNASVTSVYAVVSGSVRFSRLMQDGRRQIGAFYLPGDLFGLESEDRHSFAAESIVNSRIKMTKRGSFLEAAWSEPALAKKIWAETSVHLHRAQEHMFRLGRTTAEERVAAFVLEMDWRLRSSGLVALPMPRRDIADYLGLTIETVSRIFTLLKRQELISIPDWRHIAIRNRSALQQMSDC